MKDSEVKKTVRKNYAKVAREETSCGCSSVSCCGSTMAEDISKGIGYSQQELASLPKGANLGLGCGNPVALASLKEGEVVIDLGSGPGMDCFLASQKVGAKGRVIGVDMTPDMLDKARANTIKGGYSNVEFRLGEIENLPVADSTADVIISNCVINLSTDKKRVFQEAYRTLKSGGRLAVSDIVLLKELPQVIRDSVTAYIGCIAGAVLKDEYLKALEEAGFKGITVTGEQAFPVEYYMSSPEEARQVISRLNMNGEEAASLAATIVSIKVNAVKPKV
jgi:arsenite methyltransferase